MPTNANVPPHDSFEDDNKAFQEDKRVEMKDAHLNGIFNPARGEDRRMSETHATVPSKLG